MDDISVITTRLEYIFLKKIITYLRDTSIDVPTAKQLAKEFLLMEPFLSLVDSKNKITQFVLHYPVFVDLKKYVEAYHKEKATDAKIEQMREHMKQNNIEAAIQVAKT